MTTKAEVNDVIQIDPEHCAWGPLLCIVDEVKTATVRAYWLQVTERGTPRRAAYIMVPHDHYVVVGRAEWAFAG